MIEHWRGRKVTVMGLGRFGGGIGVTRWLAAAGADVTVTDLLDADRLAASLEQLEGCAVRLRLGGHDESDFRDADVVVVSPAVPPTSPYVEAARRAGRVVTSEILLFAERCRATCVGVTGSVGKSTVTAMIGHVLSRALPAGRRAWVGGNIGRSLLEDLPSISAQDVVVLELSSFQLELTPTIRWSPHVAVITHVAPNHLDRHGTYAAYLAAKLNILRFQDPARDHVVIHDDAELRNQFELLFGDLAGVWRYGLHGDAPLAVLQRTSAVDADTERLAWPELTLNVPGRHNRQNAAAALTVAHLLGVRSADAVEALRSFEALPHRLQRVVTSDGITYYNDSKSTTPEAALTAIAAIRQPLLLIVGGYDKGVDLSGLAREAARRVVYTACIGQTGRGLAQAVREAGGEAGYHESLDGAFEECRRRASAGDAILLSPACASYGMFEDYRARGEAFVELARRAAGGQACFT